MSEKDVVNHILYLGEVLSCVVETVPTWQENSSKLTCFESSACNFLICKQQSNVEAFASLISFSKSIFIKTKFVK